MIDAGTEPRRRVKYELAAHAPERIQIDFKLRAESDVANNVSQTRHRMLDLPTIRNITREEVTSIESKGDAIVTAEVEDSSALDDVVDPKLRKRVEAEMAAIKGWRGSWHVAPSGQISSVEVDASKSIGRVQSWLSSTMRDAIVVFPDAPIGVGATWKVVSEQSAGGATWTRTSTYKLTALSATTATLEVRSSMNAASQVLSVEPNATTRLVSATGTATAQLVVPLDKLAPTGSTHANTQVEMQYVRGRVGAAFALQTEVSSYMKPVIPVSDVSTPESTPQSRPAN